MLHLATDFSPGWGARKVQRSGPRSRQWAAERWPQAPTVEVGHENSLRPPCIFHASNCRPQKASSLSSASPIESQNQFACLSWLCELLRHCLMVPPSSLLARCGSTCTTRRTVTALGMDSSIVCVILAGTALPSLRPILRLCNIHALLEVRYQLMAMLQLTHILPYTSTCPLRDSSPFT